MAAAALAGALAMALVFSGVLGAPAADPAGTAADPAGTAADPAGTAADPAGTAPGAGSLSPPAHRPDGGDTGSAGGLKQPPPPIEPPARMGDGRADPASGATAPAGSQVFYTRADLIEFLAEGGASPPVAALAAKYPAGGHIINILTGGTTGLESDAWDADRRRISGLEPDIIVDSPMEEGGPSPPVAADSIGGSGVAAAPADVESQSFAAPAGEPSAGPAAGSGIREGAGSEVPMQDAPAAPSPAHSTTNVQVEGVDEPDFVKNDARHIYILDGGELTVIDALPADLVEVLTGDSAGDIRESYRPEDASVVFRGSIGGSDDYRYDNMFLDGDSLIVIYESRQWASALIDDADPTRAVAVQLPFTYVLWVDISDRSAPVQDAEYVVDGEYGAARMIDGIVYLVTRTGLDERGVGLPGVRHSVLDGLQPGAPCADPDAGRAALGPAAPSGRVCSSDPLVPPAYHIGPVEGEPILTTVSALPRGGPATAAAAQTYVLGSGDIEYVSRSAVYLAMPRVVPGPADVLGGLRDTGLLQAMVEPLGAQWRHAALSAAADRGLPADTRLEVVLSAIQSGYDDLGPDKRRTALAALDDTAWSWHYSVVPADPKTDIHRIAVGGAAPALSYGAAGSVRGEPLDQFSMDEYDGMLRTATNIWDGFNPPHTAVHVLDTRLMETVVSLEGIATGETMQSARFAGDTLFLVTFRQIDPFFVIDMSGSIPVILGELKIPGFSSYLQPYGADMVVGVGTYLSEDRSDRKRDGGVKVSLYDVADYSRPVLADERVIGGPDTWSPAQSSHRALLADEGRGIIALPVVFHSGYPQGAGAAVPGSAAPAVPSDSVGWTGFYAFRVSADAAGGSGSGAANAARLGDAHIIPHGAARDGAPQEGRSLYIADWLYTIYDGALVISDLYNPGRMVKSIDLG